jgi:CysZ protein
MLRGAPEMFDAAIKAITQMFSPPFRAVLMKSIGLALVLIVLIGAGVYRLLSWLTAAGGDWAEIALGPYAHTPLAIMAWMLSIAAGLGVILGSIFLMPAVTALVASFFVDEIALEVERGHYPDEPAGTPLPLAWATFEGTKTALLAVLVYLLAAPFLLFAGLGLVIFFLAAAFLLSREYFELAAMRYRPPAEAKAMRKAHQSTVFMAGLLIAALVSIPILNLATPLFGMALMVHLHKQLSRQRLPAESTA